MKEKSSKSHMHPGSGKMDTPGENFFLNDRDSLQTEMIHWILVPYMQFFP